MIHWSYSIWPYTAQMVAGSCEMAKIQAVGGPVNPSQLDKLQLRNQRIRKEKSQPNSPYSQSAVDTGYSDSRGCRLSDTIAQAGDLPIHSVSVDGVICGNMCITNLTVCFVIK